MTVNRWFWSEESELQIAGIKHPSTETVMKATTKQELARYCHRKTRGVQVTVGMLETVLAENPP